MLISLHASSAALLLASLVLVATVRVHVQERPLVACTGLKAAFSEPELPEPEGEKPEERRAGELRNEVRGPILEVRKRFRPELSEPPSIPAVDSGLERGCLRIDWNIVQEQELDETLKLFRFSEETLRKIYTSNFNFLQFSVKWTAKAEPPNPAFEKVSGLFESSSPVLSILTPKPAGSARC